MESCTGGLLSSLLTDISGASEVFPCGLATYSNAAKVTAGVDAKLIEREGVYSAACAEAMARAVRKTYGTDYAIGVTGTLGRVDPANRDSTPGEVFFCVLRAAKGEKTASAAEGEQAVSDAKGEQSASDAKGERAVSAAEGAQPASDAEGEQTSYEAFTERIELDPTLPRPEAKLAVAEAVFTRLFPLL